MESTEFEVFTNEIVSQTVFKTRQQVIRKTIVYLVMIYTVFQNMRTKYFGISEYFIYSIHNNQESINR